MSRIKLAAAAALTVAFVSGPVASATAQTLPLDPPGAPYVYVRDFYSFDACNDAGQQGQGTGQWQQYACVESADWFHVADLYVIY